MILVIGAGGRVGSAVVRRLKGQGMRVAEVHAPWSGADRELVWALDVRERQGMRHLREHPLLRDVTTIYYCASRPKGPGTAATRHRDRVVGLQNVCEVFKGVPVRYCSSRHAARQSPYGMTQRVCERIVTAAGGRFVRFPALYAPTYRPWLRWVKWIYPAWSVDEAVTALLEA